MEVVFEAPALVVRQPDKARQLFPLQRLSRVVVTGFVEWSMEALLACASEGIVVVFMDVRGQPVGRWLSGQVQKQLSLQCINEWLENPRAFQTYQNWLKAMQRMAARSAARKLSLGDWQMANKVLLEQWAEGNLNENWQNVLKSLEGMVLAVVLNHLALLGIDSECRIVGDKKLCLADDLMDLLIIDFFPVVGFWQQDYESPPGYDRKVALFERRTQRLDNLLKGALLKLHYCLKEFA